MSDLSLDRAIRLPAEVKSVEPRAEAEVDAYPLTPMQAAMLLHGQREPGFYVQQYVCTLREPLRVPEFRRAWQHLFARHPVLRTSFHLDAAPEPLQRVRAGVELPWHQHDWRDLPAAAREDALGVFLREDRATPFRTDDAPLARLALFRLADEEYRLVWTSHHALLDGHARRILLREVFEEYEACVGGREPAETERRSFGEYVRWLAEAEAADSRAFWEEELRGFHAPNEVVVEGDGGEPGRRERHTLELPGELSDALRHLARSRAVTLNTVLQGAWALLLGRYTGDADVVFGATRMCRGGGFAGAEGVVGLLSNTVPVRVRVDDADTVAGFLKRVRARWVRIRPHERTHLARIQEWRGGGGAPLFQTALSFETESAQEGLHRLGGEWPRRSFDLLQWVANPLTVVAYGGPRIALEVLYDPARFGGRAIRRMGEHFTRILRAFADDPAQPLGRIEMLSPAERLHLVEALNPPAAPGAGGATIPSLFQAQAARDPGAAAAVFQDEALTYGELDHRSNQLAHVLRKRGVGPETRVGVCMERSLELVIALAAITRAGGAYVPLDPESPPDRLRFVVDDAGVSHLLCHRHLAGRVPAEGLVTLIADPLWAQAAGESTEPVPVRVEPRGLAYLTYTSGSTGTPKGVGVEHRGVARLVRGASYAALGPGEVVLHAAPLSFDASTLEIWGALLNGGRLVLAPAATPSLEELGRTLQRHGVTTLWLTAGLFRAMVEEQLEALGGVRQLLAGGDVVPVAQVEKARKRFPELRLINGYGPTENTTFTCCYTVSGSWNGEPLPIGTPISGTRVYVLDGALRPVPEGVPGELYAGGSGVARGYLGHPAATAERFLPDPFAVEPGARMYRTGDRVRWRAAGVLEFLGRLDGQVKIRGFRIEPGEVEAVLRRHPGVRECAVVAREDSSGERRLVAYVAGEAGAEALRPHLRRTLPEYMVPAAFVSLGRIPLTPNGKLDRRALPAPEYGSAEGRSVVPRTPVEEVLAGIWAEVLGLERVGVEESFFELGGHSLLVMSVLSRVRELFAVELPVRAVFEHPTVAEMAARVEALRRAGLPAPAPLSPAVRAGAVPLSPAQERLWFIHRLDPESAAYNVPVFRRLEGPLDVPALARALSEVVRRHEALRTTLVEVDGAVAQSVAPPRGFVVAVEDLSGLGEAEREEALARRVADEAVRPFDLRSGPVFRAALLRLDARTHVLLLCMHHVVTDEWSIGVLFRELSALYGAFREGKEPPLPEPAVQYTDYALWQREQLRGAVLERRLAWWKAHLAGAPEVLELPADRPRPAVQSLRGARERFGCPGELVERLRAVGRSEGATPFMVLLGAFQVLLSRYADTDDVVVGSPIAGRTRTEVEGLIGFFANMLPLRTGLGGDPAFREVLRRVREATLGAYEHQDVPFERLVAELRPDRSLSHSPLFQVTLTLENGERSGGDLPGLRVVPVDADTGTAKFDLSLIVQADARGLRGELVYSTDLFEPGTIRAMAGRLARVLEQVAADPDTRISGLALMSGAERAQVVASGRAAASFPVAERLERRFERRAAERPEAPALSFEGATLAYGEVNERANRLAHRLRALGV
ncbi:non-ribosomal peptide synthetase, partial [Longimicrobium sp.]|uniref:non-ribosomal peptide synthetase n=1 Tax=Longimicrobium sp. TaxID=2029185 RepID=UPI002C8837A1